MNKPFRYLTCCVDISQRDVEHLNDMIDRAIDVSWRTLTKYVPVEHLQEVYPFTSYSYRKEHINPITGEQTAPFSLKDDYAVSFHRSRYKSKLCYYIRHSGIEYIFTKGGI